MGKSISIPLVAALIAVSLSVAPVSALAKPGNHHAHKHVKHKATAQKANRY